MKPGDIAKRTHETLDRKIDFEESKERYSELTRGFWNFMRRARGGATNPDIGKVVVMLDKGDDPDLGPYRLYGILQTTPERGGAGPKMPLSGLADGFKFEVEVTYLQDHSRKPLPDLSESFAYPGAAGQPSSPTWDQSHWIEEWEPKPRHPSLPAQPLSPDMVWPQFNVPNGGRNGINVLEMWLDQAEPAAVDTLAMLTQAASDPTLNPTLAANLAATP